MPVNLEIKVRVHSHRKIKNLLKMKKAEYAGILKQKDVYYKFSGGLLKLRIENNKFQLIKYLRDEKGKRWSNYEILSIQGKNIEQYFSRILEVEAVVEKTRYLYHYKNTRIHLDYVKKLGYFLELETLLVGGKKEAQKEFNEVVDFLKLNLNEQIRSSYKNLIVKL